MSFIEGGDFVCFVHNFTTDNIEDWDKHCFKTRHTISGSTGCVACGKMVQFNNLPFIGTGKSPNLKCEECSND